MKNIQRSIKRQADFWGALLGLVILVPLFLVIALAIKTNSPGPVFFRYERVGKDGKAFWPFKFRTMAEGAIEQGLGYTVAERDPRITSVGRFLRTWGIDELPQLLNVLKGEMSIVGPRPTFRYQVDNYTPEQRRRLEVRPGIVGLALIRGRNLLSWEDRIRYDLEYIDRWSLWLDAKIIILSFYVILIKREGVFGKGGINDPFVS